MPLGLSQIARQLLTNREAALRTLTMPHLVWEAPSGPNPEEAWQHTGAGSVMSRPRQGEPLVFALAKVPGLKNPFAMGITVGRVDTNDVQLDDASVSRFHAYFQFDERAQAWQLTDAESKNGTFLDGVKLAANAKNRLKDGALLRFGEVSLRFLLPQALVDYVEDKARR